MPRLLDNVVFEVIPLKDAARKARDLPPGAKVSVTASPAKGLAATIELCEELAGAGFDVIPHLSARLLASEFELLTLVGRLRDAGVERAFVIGGDDGPGVAFPDAAALLRGLERLDHPFREIGVAAYPEGHPSIPPDALHRSLVEKQRWASYMVSQMCFDPVTIGHWLRGERAEGVTLPLVVGIPGVTDPARLALIGARIGVGQSLRYLRKNARGILRLLWPGPYDPSRLVGRLSGLAEDPAAGVVGLHVFTFNQIEATTAWYERALRH